MKKSGHRTQVNGLLRKFREKPRIQIKTVDNFWSTKRKNNNNNTSFTSSSHPFPFETLQSLVEKERVRKSDERTYAPIYGCKGRGVESESRWKGQSTKDKKTTVIGTTRTTTKGVGSFWKEACETLWREGQGLQEKHRPLPTTNQGAAKHYFEARRQDWKTGEGNQWAAKKNQKWNGYKNGRVGRKGQWLNGNFKNNKRASKTTQPIECRPTP